MRKVKLAKIKRRENKSQLYFDLVKQLVMNTYSFGELESQYTQTIPKSPNISKPFSIDLTYSNSPRLIDSLSGSKIIPIDKSEKSIHACTHYAANKRQKLVG